MVTIKEQIQWQMRDFPEDGVRQLPNSDYFASFVENCMKMKEFELSGAHP